MRNDKTWSSNKIVEELYPTFQKEGNPIICYPVENYPLNVKATFLPKQAGSGDPSPENVRPISGRDEVTVTRCGKNLFNSSSVSTGKDFELALSYNSENQTFTLNGTTTDPSRSYFIQSLEVLIPTSERTSITVVKTGGNITIPDGGMALVYFGKGDSLDETVNSLLNASLGGGSKTSWSDTNKKYYTKVWLYITGGVVCDDLQFKIMVEYGDPTAYEPYQGTTHTLTLPETIYGGEVDAVTGEGSKEWEYYEITGKELWQVGSDNLTNVYRYYFSPPQDQIYGRTMEGYCNVYKTLSSITTDETGVIFGHDNSNIYLYLPKTDYPDVASVKSYLAAQYAAGTPVTICYKLATPEPFQSTGNQPIPALEGENTVYTDGDNLIISGKENIKYTINQIISNIQNINQIQEINNILLGVE